MLYKGDPTPIDIEKAPLRFSNRLAGCSGPIAMDTLMGGLSTCRGEIDETEAQEV